MKRKVNNPETPEILWEFFYTQSDALSRAASAKDRELLVLAMDKDATGRKIYAVASPEAAYNACLSKGVSYDMHQGQHVGIHQYELLPYDRLMRLYYDAEFAVALNPGKSGERCLATLHAYAKRAYAEIPGRPREALVDEDFGVETSHREGVKVSNHGKIAHKCGVVANMDAQRAFWAHVACLASDDPDFHVMEECAGKVQQTTFWDRKVYTKNRLMRMLGACKWLASGTEPRYLVPEGKTRDSVTLAQWCDALILNVGESPQVLDIPAAWYDEARLVWPTASTLSARPRKLRPPTAEPVADPVKLLAALKSYHARVLPFGALVRMITMNGRVPLDARVLPLEKPNGGGFVRHYAHGTFEQLKQAFAFYTPAVVHLGGACEATLFVADGVHVGRTKWRELTFDVDINDYDKDGVRYCACAGLKKLCPDCWFILEASASTLKHTLVTRLGIDERHLLWVFSGGRGWHCWVNVGSYMRMSDEERKVMAARVCPLLNPENFQLPASTNLSIATYNILRDHFIDRGIVRRKLMAQRGVIDTWIKWIKELGDYCLPLIRHVKLRFGNGVEINGTSDEWDEFCGLATEHAPRAHVAYWIIAHYAWPRADAHVMSGKNTTLKAPFSVHATTQRLALPIDCPANGVDQNELLSVHDVCRAYDTAPVAFHAGVKRLQDWCEMYPTHT